MLYGWKTVMVEPRDHARTGLLLLALGLSSGALGCASAPPSPSTPPSEAAPPPAAPPPEIAAPPVAPEVVASAPAPTAQAPTTGRRDSNVIVVDPGGEESGEVTLAEAARAERERKARAGPPVAVITNKTLPQSTGQVTFGKPKPEKKETAGEDSTGAALQKEQYWRERGLEIRTRWHSATEEIQELERSAADLRRRFYAEDDPYFRDGQIKPEWDRVLDRLRETRVQSDRAREDLATFLEEGRRAGALPGWLREGVELEPVIEKKEPTTPEPIEPPVIEEDGV